ncbi:metallophosphoesterase [Streptomyces sp. NBC_01506]|uniref:metallophosphoesterase n=1 Tax=Streptomyces sp. NBC_01506 TaxID=2903887 RepID=UPI003862E5F5
MTQGAGTGQGPVVRTATLRDFRVPPYTQVPARAGQPEPATSGTPDDRPGAPGSLGEPPRTDPRTDSAQAPTPVATNVSDAPSPPDPRRLVGTEAGTPDTPATPAVPPAPPAPAAPAPATDDATSSSRISGISRITDHGGNVGHVGHPGNAIPRDEVPEGYTPTERDLPVIKRADKARTRVDPAESPAEADGLGPLYVVGDVHGYLDELVAALAEQGLIDHEGNWAAGNTRLWFLGDFTDRGPDGVGVIDLVMRLSAEAAAAGGYCKALMGNHELLLLGAKRFADTPVNSGAGTATFQAAWLLNGGQKTDMERLQDVHLQWMSRLDALVEEDGHLLMHSDTTAYLDYGTTIEDVNDNVRAILTRNDADECWDIFRKLTKRFAFRDNGGPEAARELMAAYGGRRIVHGHSPIPYLLGEVGTEEPSDGEENAGPVVDGPHVYADGLAIAMDGGVTMAGKLLVVRLPLHN